MEQNQQKQEFKCSGDCLKCPRVQREYCAAQKGYDNQRLLLALQEAVSDMQDCVYALEEKIAAIQDNEAMVFDPNSTPEPVPTENIIQAQSGDGA